MLCGWRAALDVVDVDILAAGSALAVGLGVAVLVELEAAVALVAGAVRVGLVDLGALGQLAVGLEGAGLVGRVLEDHVALLVLVVAQREQDDVAVVDPHLLAQLAADVGQSLRSVEALRLEAAVAEHLDYLGVLCWFLLLAISEI